MDTPPNERYQGEEKLVISIDIGTTMSAVAYTHLFPGSVPQVSMVNRWPGQEATPGDSKVPSLVAYQGGRPIAFGAEALEHAGADGVFTAKWFKLHLHPDSMRGDHEPPAYRNTAGVVPNLEIPPLPPRVSLKKIYADLLEYLFKHARGFFKNNTVNGAITWARAGDQVTICLATPNGWETSQQAFLREACIAGGLLPKVHNESRLRFVTEGEASVHYALHYTKSFQWLRKGVLFAVVDAGGSTVDSTLYECEETTPKLLLKEVCASECVQAGSMFINRAAQHMLETKLQGGQFGNGAYIQDILEDFEKRTKRVFDGTQVSSIIKFGKDWDNDYEHGVQKGRITLTKEDLENMFNEVVPRIVSSCSNLISGRKVKYLLLVGGFGESPYLRFWLKETFANKNVQVVAVDEPTKKAAAEGAAIWFSKQLVVARAARSTFGVIFVQPFNRQNPDHFARKHLRFVDNDGVEKIDGLFETWVKKNSVIGEELSEPFSYWNPYKTLDYGLGTFSVDIYAYDGEGGTKWAKDESGELLPNIRLACTLKADLSGLRGILNAQTGENGQKFWRVDFGVNVFFGGTALKARLTWNEGGTRREGPIGIIPDSVLY